MPQRTGRWDLGAGIWALGFGRWDLGAWIWALGCGHWDAGTGMRALGCGRWDAGTGMRLSRMTHAWQPHLQPFERGAGSVRVAEIGRDSGGCGGPNGFDEISWRPLSPPTAVDLHLRQLPPGRGGGREGGRVRHVDGCAAVADAPNRTRPELVVTSPAPIRAVRADPGAGIRTSHLDPDAGIPTPQRDPDATAEFSPRRPPLASGYLGGISAPRPTMWRPEHLSSSRTSTGGCVSAAVRRAPSRRHRRRRCRE